jgi:ABC-type multidrug transport system ATPase subunit
MSDIVLQTSNLSKRFGRQTAVDQINITVHQGEVFGFLGPNGAGKTTTLGMALGLVHPSEGEVRVLGERVTPQRTRALQQVGALLGAPAFVPYLSAWDNLALVARLTPGVDKQRIAETLALVGLSDTGRKKVGKFSTGMKQRMGLALALAHRPRFVILDEPTNGLDPAGMREIRQLIRSLVENGTSVLLSSHLLHEVQQVCDRIAVLHKGRVVAQGHVADLLSQSKPVVRVMVADVETAVAALQSLPHIESIRPNGASILVVGQESQAILTHLLQHNIIPSEIAAQPISLESLFMDVTQGAAASGMGQAEG